jgi:hypothetical protein
MLDEAFTSELRQQGAFSHTTPTSKAPLKV